MNEYGPPDWEEVFHRARRRMLGRLLLVAVLAAVGAGLLLNGGLAAEGAAPWLPINKENESQPSHDDQENLPEPQERRRPHEKQSIERDSHPPVHHRKHGGKEHGKDRKEDEGKIDKPHCPEDSAGAQYCDSPPKTPAEGSTGSTATGAGDVAEAGEAAATGAVAPSPED